MEDLRALAEKLEQVFAKAHAALLKAIQLDMELALETLADIQAKILGFDSHERRRYGEALEEKRVQTLAQGNVFMTCVLSSAVALSEFKNQPRSAGGGFLKRRLDRFKGRSTSGLSLTALTFASFYALLGRGALKRLKSRGKKAIPL